MRKKLCWLIFLILILILILAFATMGLFYFNIIEIKPEMIKNIVLNKDKKFEWAIVTSIISFIGILVTTIESKKLLNNQNITHRDLRSDWYKRINRIEDECTEKTIADCKELWINRLLALLNPSLKTDEIKDINSIKKVLGEEKELDIEQIKDIALIYLNSILEEKIAPSNKEIAKNIQLISRTLHHHTWFYIDDKFDKKKTNDLKNLCSNFKEKFIVSYDKN